MIFVKIQESWTGAKRKSKTYNSRDSPMVTHLTTSPPVLCLNRAERTGSLVFKVLWSYVLGLSLNLIYIEYDTCTSLPMLYLQRFEVFGGPIPN
ncbi:hypothetical protein K505DRAFT_400089 [Melanomma pulvis-pyrius CBS 109.77]|uniref:Uncharacterized protein n=1 Tax=Melanomma pulvis-pyrius CBS 109.77 TaxID=1314802 RepID=A0A6A6WQ95_9PLEO|nr:hypothetical protein K505DRAFT_400089 [Melanomma pulvis-pyrius CBS 109.77]